MSLRSHDGVIVIHPGPNLHKKYEAKLISPAEAAK